MSTDAVSPVISSETLSSLDHPQSHTFVISVFRSVCEKVASIQSEYHDLKQTLQSKERTAAQQNTKLLAVEKSLSEKELHIQELQGQLDELRERLATDAITFTQSIDRQKERYEQTLEKKQQFIEEQSTTIESLGAENFQLKITLTNQTEELCNLEKEINQIKWLKKTLEEDLANVSKSTSQAKSSLQLLESQVSDLLTSNKNLTDLTERQRVALESMKSIASKRQTQIQDIQQEQSEVVNNYTSQLQALNELKSQYTSLKSENQKLVSINEQLKEKNVNFSKLLSESSSLADTKVESLTKMEQELNHKNNLIMNLELKFEEVKQQTTRLQCQHELSSMFGYDNCARFLDISQKLREQTIDNSSLNEQLTVVRSELLDIEQKYSLQSEEIQRLNEDRKDLNDEINRFEQLIKEVETSEKVPLSKLMIAASTETITPRCVDIGLNTEETNEVEAVETIVKQSEKTSTINEQDKISSKISKTTRKRRAELPPSKELKKFSMFTGGLLCVCMGRKNSETVMCQKCMTSYHAECVGVDLTNEQDVNNFTCRECKVFCL
ncbi:hypothetical protein RCL1_001047 [Eukaryota sp. TZLM3-RCL]